VSSSKEIVCCQLQTPCLSENKNTKKLLQNTRKCCLRHATSVRFSKFCLRRISKSHSARLFYAPNQKNALSFPDFCQKACSLIRAFSVLSSYFNVSVEKDKQTDRQTVTDKYSNILTDRLTSRPTSRKTHPHTQMPTNKHMLQCARLLAHSHVHAHTLT